MRMKTQLTMESRRSRRGSAYLVTLGAALIVSALALSAVVVVRVQLRESADSGDIIRARLYARAGLDMALYRANHDSNWRQHAAQWAADQAIGSGTYNFTMTDPVDGNLANSSYDPVEVVATGKCGTAVQKLRARLDVATPGYDCLKSAAHSAAQGQWKDATVTADQWITSNSSIQVQSDGGQGAIVNASLAASGGVTKDGSSVINGQATSSGSWPMSMPDTAHVLDYYLTNGTWIDPTSLSTWESQLLVNPGMEGPWPLSPTTGWQNYGACALASVTLTVKYGLRSLEANSRTSAAAGPAQDVTAMIASGATYNTTLYIYTVSVTDSARVSLTTVSTASGTQVFSTPWVKADKTTWVKLTGDLTPTWSGQLTTALLRVETKTLTGSFRIDGDTKTSGDGSVFYEKAPQSGYAAWPRMHRAVLSPQSNPFRAIWGSAPYYGLDPSEPLNPEGIYVVDVSSAGGKISLDRIRVVGTLVVLNGDAYAWGPLNWTPAVANYPALLCRGNINLWLGTPTPGQATLSEGDANANFNPAGTPYMGVENTTRTDTYPVLVRGIVYATGNINLQHHAAIEGVVVANGSIQSQASSADGLGGAVGRTYIDLTYSNLFYKSAPPGFRTGPVLKVVPGSFRPVVN